MSASNRRYLLLDAMRGVAALAVVWGHLMDSWMREDLSSPLYVLAVDFFFILSGFVIAHAYGQRLKTGMSPITFGVIRAIRLYPLLIVGAAIGTVMLIAEHAGLPGYTLDVELGTGALAMLGLPSLLITTTALAFPANGPAWSLFFELSANFIYAFIARFLTRNRVIILVLIAGAALIAAALEAGTVGVGWAKGEIEEGFARVMFGFFTGVLIYEFRPALLSSPRVGYVLLGVLALCLATPMKENVAVELILAMAAFPVMVWLGSTVRENAFIARAGGYIGAISYPIYILHWPFVDLTRDMFRMIDPASHFAPLWAVLQLGILITIAHFAMKLFDEPVRAWLTRAIRRKPAAPMAPA